NQDDCSLISYPDVDCAHPSYYRAEKHSSTDDRILVLKYRVSCSNIPAFAYRKSDSFAHSCLYPLHNEHAAASNYFELKEIKLFPRITEKAMYFFLSYK